MGPSDSPSVHRVSSLSCRKRTRRKLTVSKVGGPLVPLAVVIGVVTVLGVVRVRLDEVTSTTWRPKGVEATPRHWPTVRGRREWTCGRRTRVSNVSHQTTGLGSQLRSLYFPGTWRTLGSVPDQFSPGPTSGFRINGAVAFDTRTRKRDLGGEKVRIRAVVSTVGRRSVESSGRAGLGHSRRVQSLTPVGVSRRREKCPGTTPSVSSR